MTQPTAYEQYMLELVNRARLDFDAEITRIGLVATKDEDGDGDVDYQDTLNYGRQKYITDYGKAPSSVAILTNGSRQVLVFNPLLTEASRSHTDWMFDTDVFSHYETNSSVDSYTGYYPSDRATNAGYSYSAIGENVAWQGTTGTPNVLSFVQKSHEGLFTSFGHRVNIMNNTYRELGIGIGEGVFTSNGKDYNSVLTTQLFGKSGSSIFLTGVAYNDLVTNDNFYSVGEGLNGIRVTAKRQSDNKSFITNTMTAGGYQIALTADTYLVIFSLEGQSLGSRQTVTIGNQNVKLDLNTDKIIDNLDLDSSLIVGTAKNDDLVGSAADQTLRGYVGSDRLFGLEGNDTLFGYDDNDILIGGRGNDFLSGGSGDDVLIGVSPTQSNRGAGESDRLIGGAGVDTFVLGDTSKAFYIYKGIKDKAILSDFSSTEDKIRLHGTSSDYQLIENTGGTEILYTATTSGISESIGIIQNSFGLNLSSSEFIYV